MLGSLDLERRRDMKKFLVLTILICSPGFAQAATQVLPEPVSWVLLGLGLAGLVGLKKKFKK